MNKTLKIIDKYLDDPLLESSNPRSRINSMRKEIEASVKNGQLDDLVREKIAETLIKLQRYEPTSNEGGGVDHWVSLEKENDGDVVLWEDIKKIIDSNFTA